MPDETLGWPRVSGDGNKIGNKRGGYLLTPPPLKYRGGQVLRYTPLKTPDWMRGMDPSFVKRRGALGLSGSTHNAFDVFPRVSSETWRAMKGNALVL